MELKPCPFCGNSKVKMESGFPPPGGFGVSCPLKIGCDSYGPNKPTPSEAAEAWNNRPKEDVDTVFDNLR